MAFPLMAAAPANSRGVSLLARSLRLRHVILPLGNRHEEEAAREWLALIPSLAGDHPEIINRVRKLQFLPCPLTTTVFRSSGWPWAFHTVACHR